jgi:hypothetical protein
LRVTRYVASSGPSPTARPPVARLPLPTLCAGRGWDELSAAPPAQTRRSASASRTASSMHPSASACARSRP